MKKHGEKGFAGFANRIDDIEPKKFLLPQQNINFPNKILIFPTNSFTDLTKSSVGTSKIFLGQRNKIVGSISTIHFANPANFFPL